MRNLLLLILIFLTISCEKNIFGPNRGTVRGTVTDENNVALHNVTVSAKFLVSIDEDGQKKFETVNTVTDQSGYYELLEVGLDENEITFTRLGFDTLTSYINISQANNDRRLNVELIGSPVFDIIRLSPSTVSLAAEDSTHMEVSFTDMYQEQGGEYQVNVLFYLNNILEHSFSFESKASSFTTHVYERNVYGTDLDAAGVYSISVEIKDPDGNLVQAENITSLTVME